MEIRVDRFYKGPSYTIGRLYINGIYCCDTLEDIDRGLCEHMSVEAISKIKVYGETAIPRGRYKIDMNTYSPSFGSRAFYKEVCEGKLPRLIGVKGFDGILIHVGDGPKGKDLTLGCILVGKNTIKGQLTDGKNVFMSLYTVLNEAYKNGEEIWITIE